MHPGYWGLFGGKVDSGERPKQAVSREIQEELGIAAADITLKSLCDVKICRQNSDSVLGVRYFTAALNVDMDKLTLKRNSEEDKVEGEGLGWFTAEEIHHLIVRPEDRTAISSFFNGNGT